MKVSPDIGIIVIVLVLVVAGVVMIYSSSGIMSGESQKYRIDPLLFLRKQLVWMVLGIVMMLVFMYLDYHILEKLKYPLFALTVALLFLVLTPKFGKEAGGAVRWFRLGPVSFQPSELAKFCLIVFLASSLSKKQKKVESFTYGILPYIIVTGALVVLILRQPDFGTVVLLGIIFVGMLFLAGARIFYLVGIALCSLPVIYALIFSSAYRRARVLAFLHPGNDPLGKGYHTIQSLIALGSGGPAGLGLGAGRQKLFFLPAPHTDFIISVIGEEFGFAGTLTVVLLFMGFLWLGASIMLEAKDKFGRLLAGGITFIIVLQAFFNMGVASGILPVKGVPLPFISFGGSSLVFMMACAGVLVSVWRHRPKLKPQSLKLKVKS